MNERAAFVAELRARRTIIADEIKQQVRDLDYFNGLHPDWPPILLDDDGELARACRSVGLDLATLEREARGQA